LRHFLHCLCANQLVSVTVISMVCVFEMGPYFSRRTSFWNNVLVIIGASDLDFTYITRSLDLHRSLFGLHIKSYQRPPDDRNWMNQSLEKMIEAAPRQEAVASIRNNFNTKVPWLSRIQHRPQSRNRRHLHLTSSRHRKFWNRRPRIFQLPLQMICSVSW